MNSKPHIIFDFSNTLLFATNPTHRGSLNQLHQSQSNHTSYTFLDYFHFNDELLDWIKKHRNQAIFSIFTTGRIQEAPEVQARIKGLFDRIYTVADIGILKSDPQSFHHILSKLGTNPDNAIFIDDSLSNIQAAQTAGLQTIHHHSNSQTLPQLKKFISLSHSSKTHPN